MIFKSFNCHYYKIVFNNNFITAAKNKRNPPDPLISLPYSQPVQTNFLSIFPNFGNSVSYLVPQKISLS